ncbi:hypothetical protein IFM89_038184 [Coptis chinensis]|uniref:Uncharacterized protein n=1 Tax=Coptis chinensis TaxID=261450 RepID=A0A835M651_9MAGN|nr:hypothetical protein IFM89_038184 [Coptis chinensis]
MVVPSRSFDGGLYVLGGFSSFTMKCVWCFNPILNMWSEGRGGLTPLQSAEVYDPCTRLWSEVPSMPFSKAQLLPTAFLADMFKPIATVVCAAEPILLALFC